VFYRVKDENLTEKARMVDPCVPSSDLSAFPSELLPDENRIERLWLALHAKVTRNHKHGRLALLCADIAAYLNYISPLRPKATAARPPAHFATHESLNAQAAEPLPRSSVPESRPAI
jgi:hypothetical protein